MTKEDSFERYLLARRAEIDAALDSVLPTPPTCPSLIAEAMRYSVFAGGKRIRPILTLASAEALMEGESTEASIRSDWNQILIGACAIELVHTYSLVHDDLPAMDDDNLRRGRPTAHIVYGEGNAILTGDALLTQAFFALARQSATDSPELEHRRARAIACIAGAAGAGGMVGGQALDLAATGTQSGGIEALRDMHERKTGALIKAAAVCGAILAGGKPQAIEAIETYATHLGLAFQIVDDILDVEGKTDELGKTAGKDATNDKSTYPALHGIDRSRVLASEAAEASKAALATAGLGGRLAKLADWVLSRTH